MNENEFEIYYVKHIYVNTFKKIIEEYEKLKRTNHIWLFKGHSDSTWHLSTMFERCLRNYPIDNKKKIEIEKEIIKEFERKAALYLDEIPDHNNYLEWLSLMRHYGAPCRALDFTYSFYVALYFAIEEMKWNEKDNKIKSCAVYAINNNLFKSSKLKSRYLFMPNMDGLEFDTDKKRKKFIWDKDNPDNFVFNLTPYFLNKRITIQQGTFLLPWNIEEKFEDNLKGNCDLNCPKKSQHYIKKMIITLTKKERKEIIQELHKMNINKATLFPGITGFAESLSIRLELDK